MNPFWKTICGTLAGAASLIAAHYSADWLANHTYRAKAKPPMLAEVPKPAYVPAHSTVRVPNYYQRHTTDYRSTPDYPIRPYRSRH